MPLVSYAVSRLTISSSLFKDKSQTDMTTDGVNKKKSISPNIIFINYVIVILTN